MRLSHPPCALSCGQVFQLETAMGSAIECFGNAGAIVVPRSRFSPVKTCNELFALRTDAFKVTEASTVELATPKVPLVKLDDKHYKLVDKMEELVDEPPSMAACTSLKVSGAVRFAKGVVLEGDVSVSNGASTSHYSTGHPLPFSHFCPATYCFGFMSNIQSLNPSASVCQCSMFLFLPLP